MRVLLPSARMPVVCHLPFSSPSLSIFPPFVRVVSLSLLQYGASSDLRTLSVAFLDLYFAALYFIFRPETDSTLPASPHQSCHLSQSEFELLKNPLLLSAISMVGLHSIPGFDVLREKSSPPFTLEQPGKSYLLRTFARKSFLTYATFVDREIYPFIFP